MDTVLEKRWSELRAQWFDIMIRLNKYSNTPDVLEKGVEMCLEIEHEMRTLAPNHPDLELCNIRSTFPAPQPQELTLEE